MDGAGSAYVTGETWSTDFPTTVGAFDPTFNGGSRDAFVARLATLGNVVDREPNDSPDQASPLPIGTASLGYFGAPGRDQDWYRFTLVRPGRLSVRLAPPAGGGNWASDPGLGLRVTTASGSPVLAENYTTGGTTAAAEVAVSIDAAGDYHSVALKSDGSVWAWGGNDYGQVGDGTTTPRLIPVQVGGLGGVVALAAGDSHSLALKSDGTVRAWGYNWAGQLGDGTTTQRLTPVRVSGLSGVAAVAAGIYHGLAVKNDGTAWAWGYNAYGQLGDDSTT
ncbi:MAG: hypothetical protein HY690_04150, partial [Chloroflexi bacterium]|nr:hypothetical protein [Chloroflexota bacterium]